MVENRVTIRFVACQLHVHHIARFPADDASRVAPAQELGPIGLVRVEDKRPAEVIGFMQGRLKAAYKVLNDELANKNWLVGDRLTIADTACCGYLFYPEPFGFDRAEWPHIDAWLTRIEQTPGWKHPYDLMPGSPADRA